MPLLPCLRPRIRAPQVPCTAANCVACKGDGSCKACDSGFKLSGGQCTAEVSGLAACCLLACWRCGRRCRCCCYAGGAPEKHLRQPAANIPPHRHLPAATPPAPPPLQITCNVDNCKQCTISTGKCKECKARYWLNSFNNRCVRWL
jgi:hypothetical protein